MDFNEMNEELKARVAKCKSPEELLALAKEEGYELTDEELTAVSGGEDTWDCPHICNQ